MEKQTKNIKYKTMENTKLKNKESVEAKICYAIINYLDNFIYEINSFSKSNSMYVDKTFNFGRVKFTLSYNYYLVGDGRNEPQEMELVSQGISRLSISFHDSTTCVCTKRIKEMVNKALNQ